MTKKMTKHQLTIDSLSNSGDGIGRINDKVVFIPFSVPGDFVEVEITQDKKSFSKARIVKILTPSDSRIPPECEYFTTCGGCDWQFLPYSKQLEWKQNHLIDTLKRVAGVRADSNLKPIQACTTPYAYRNRVQLHFDNKGPYYFSKGSKNPCYINSCPIADTKINTWLSDYKKNSLKLKGKYEIAKSINGEVEIFKVNQIGQSELGFRQVNDEQNTFITAELLKLIENQNISKVTDLYCGQGNWSLSIAKQSSQTQCLGVDINPVNIKAAKKSQLTNTKFLLGDVTELYDEWANQTDLTIIDPPRAGCDSKTLELLTRQASPWLAYISCHPATMARDLKTLITSGWQLETIQPIDMFPQTSHLECLTILRSATPLKTANP